MSFSLSKIRQNSQLHNISIIIPGNQQLASQQISPRHHPWRNQSTFASSVDTTIIKIECTNIYPSNIRSNLKWQCTVTGYHNPIDNDLVNIVHLHSWEKNIEHIEGVVVMNNTVVEFLPIVAGW